MRRLLLQQYHLLPQIAPSHVGLEITSLLTQRSYKQSYLLFNMHIILEKFIIFC